MQNLMVTHSFMRKLTKNIRNAYGKDVPNTKVLDLVADALGVQAGPLMNALKTAGGDGEATIPSSPAIHIGRDNVPDLTELGVMDNFDLDVMRELGRKKNGLVLVTGVTGSGKTVFSNSLVRQWVKDSGNTAFTVGEFIEYPNLAGRHGEGIIIQNETRGRQPLRDIVPIMLSYAPAYLLANDHLHASDIRIRGLPTHLSDFMTAIELSEDRVVVVSGHGATPTDFIAGMTNDFARATGQKPEDAAHRIHKALSAIVYVRRIWNKAGPASFAAQLSR
jgi:hypothetical protein